jgi:hypothetical protein
MFDSTTLKLIRESENRRGKRPRWDLLAPASKRIFTNNHGSHDAATGEVAGTVKLEGDGEEAVISAVGLIYINSENTNDMVVFDPKSLQVKKRFPITGAKTPTGLAHDAKTKPPLHRLPERAKDDRDGCSRRQDRGQLSDRQERGLCGL